MPEFSRASDAGIAGLDAWRRCLLFYARCLAPLPGRKSALREFRRRQVGKAFRAFTRHGFWVEGKSVDSIENHVAVFGEFEPGLSRFVKRVSPQTKTFVDEKEWQEGSFESPGNEHGGNPPFRRVFLPGAENALTARVLARYSIDGKANPSRSRFRQSIGQSIDLPQEQRRIIVRP